MHCVYLEFLFFFGVDTLQTFAGAYRWNLDVKVRLFKKYEKLVLFLMFWSLKLTYHYFSRCRHATIASYFGDTKPQCNKCCDCCKNPQLVKKQTEHLQTLLLGRSRTSIEQPGARPGPFGYNSDLYEGGRKGYGFEM